MTMWMVRAERGGVLFDDFMANKYVTVGWAGAGDASNAASRQILRERVAIGHPDLKPGEAASGGNVLWRFAHEIRVGDDILTYDPTARAYALGKVSGPYRYDDEKPVILDGNAHPHVLPVTWVSEFDRDALSEGARNTLGSIISLFQVRQEVSDEVARVAAGEIVAVDSPVRQPAQSASFEDAEDAPDSETGATPTAAALEEQAMTGIADLVTAISPDDMEQFVAGLLRALGYHARVSPKGPDRGRDILATPDPLGLEDPRIHVEVKHRAGKASPGMIRSFLGGRGPNDRGIFVSTGGFTREARYEADRASIPVQLLDSEDLVRLLIENYGKLKPDIARMVPLRRIWWPH